MTFEMRFDTEPPKGHTFESIMEFIDAGLHPFVICQVCEELMPVSVGHGPFGTIIVTCPRCKGVSPTRLLQFLTHDEAISVGWLLRETPRRAH